MKKVTAFDISTKKLSWDKLFDSEEELVEAMQQCPVRGRDGIVPAGYEYIAGFQRYFTKHGCLTPNQMTQLKRLAKSVYIGLNRMSVGGYMAVAAPW